MIAVFAILILLAGLAFTGSGTSMKSYFAAGGSMPWWLSGLSLFMSFFSAGTFVVWGSIAYEHGWVAISIQWMMALGGFIIGFFIAPKWRKTGVLTVGQYLGDRFGTSLKQFYSYLFLLLSFVTTGAFLYPVARLFNAASGFSVEASIAVIGLLIIGYTTAGGLWAVVITDVLQFVILSAGLVMIIPLAFQEIGGISRFVELAPAGFFDLVNTEYSLGFLGAFLFYNTIFIGGNWAYVQRYTSVASEKNAKKAAWLFGSLYLICPILWMLPPMIFRQLDGGSLIGLQNETAFLLISKRVLPIGLLGLMLGGMIFATASSVTTTLNMSAAVFTNDVIPRFNQSLSDLKRMRIARLSTVVLGLLTIAVALLVPRLGGIVEVVLSVGAITGAPFFAPAIWTLFSRRQTSQSIIFTTLFSLAINCFFKFLSPLLLNLSLDRASEMLVGVGTPLLLLGLFEIVLPVQKDIPKVIPPQPVEPVTGPSNQNMRALKVLGVALIIIGLFIAFLGIFSEVSWIILTGTSMFVLIPGILAFRRT